MVSTLPPERERNRQSHNNHDDEEVALRDLASSALPAGSTSADCPEDIARKPWKISIVSPSIDVRLSSARDHLANERVFLAYFRTSSALATFAVVLVQLYRLKHDPPPPGVLSGYDIGIPLASIILVMAMLVTLLGTARFFICQKSIAASRIVGSGQVVSLFTAATTMVSH